MAENPQLSLSPQNIVIGVVCIIAANLLLALIEMGIALPGPHWIWSSIATAVAVVVWFALAARLRR